MLGAMAAVSQAEPVSVTIDARQTSAPVSRYEYGMFIEPIRDLIARSLWAEMLDDRKFYYPIVAAGTDAPVPGAAARTGATDKKWRPIGGDDAVSMDPHAPYVGTQSASILLQGDTPRGIAQSGLGVAKGKHYVGHLLLSGDSTAHLEVMLAWGSMPDAQQIVALPAPTSAWRSVPFEFTARRLDDARLEISGTGNGKFQIGAASLMPADNINGWRADTTGILRSLHSGMWRLPGGNFLSNWDWHSAIGPRDKRAPMFDHAWSAMQPNDLGHGRFHGANEDHWRRALVTVNAGLGDANSAAEEVDYFNGP